MLLSDRLTRWICFGKSRFHLLTSGQIAIRVLVLRPQFPDWSCLVGRELENESLEESTSVCDSLNISDTVPPDSKGSLPLTWFVVDLQLELQELDSQGYLFGEGLQAKLKDLGRNARLIVADVLHGCCIRGSDPQNVYVVDEHNLTCRFIHLPSNTRRLSRGTEQNSRSFHALDEC